MQQNREVLLQGRVMPQIARMKMLPMYRFTLFGTLSSVMNGHVILQALTH